MKQKIFIEQKIVCDICGKKFTKLLPSEKTVTKNYSKTCQTCWDKTMEQLEKGDSE